MDIFHFFKIVQMVLNGATHQISYHHCNVTHCLCIISNKLQSDKLSFLLILDKFWQCLVVTYSEAVFN